MSSETVKQYSGDDRVSVVAWRTEGGQEARITYQGGLLTYEDSGAAMLPHAIGAEHTRGAEIPGVVWRLVWRAEAPPLDEVWGEGADCGEVVMGTAQIKGLLGRVYATRAAAEEAVDRCGILHPIPLQILRHVDAEPAVLVPLFGDRPEALPPEWRGPLTSGWLLLHTHTDGGALRAVMAERASQRVKWSASHDDLHTLAELAALATHYITRGAMAPGREVLSWRRPFIQGAALALAALESIHRKAFGALAKDATAREVEALKEGGWRPVGLNVWEQIHDNISLRIVARITLHGIAWRILFMEAERRAVYHTTYKSARAAMAVAVDLYRLGIAERWLAEMASVSDEEEAGDAG